MECGPFFVRQDNIWHTLNISHPLSLAECRHLCALFDDFRSEVKTFPHNTRGVLALGGTCISQELVTASCECFFSTFVLPPIGKRWVNIDMFICNLFVIITSSCTVYIQYDHMFIFQLNCFLCKEPMSNVRKSTLQMSYSCIIISLLLKDV